ncbi:MAG TPA: serine/threonine-protein kinase [Anaerohalosphaeraceae bacterium]|nr:serine/threonine-protein kinase [Anaerohalosphaeraceae bacterium]HRT49070.1 serine/threonine-protein kinase [Anaerohalosphaeraceae bacterium]HRT85677.1 serine/threonine-protein kinase [Anaerohalosphaeraceae bacterium]
MSETSQDTLFGRMALEQRLCTEEELQRCQKELRQRAKANEPATVEQVLQEYGFITATQAARLKENIKESKDAAGKIPGYKVVGKLGSGAMAVVYKAKQLSLDRTVAIKVLPRRFTEKSDYIKRFFKEGRIAAKLNHNNIVQAIDVGEAGGVYYFVMEYVEGKTLYDDLSKGKIFDEAEALEIIIQLAKALAHAHAHGMIHRDVKPKNVMINKEGVVKLADMGLARETSDVEAAKNEQGKAFGTPYYIAPEQIRGEVNIDGRADLYALGATFYHMVTGRVPFEASTPAEVMKKHLKEPLTPPDHINTALSQGTAEVIEVMMAKNKQDRYSSMEEALVDLEAVREGKPPLRARRKFNLEGLEQLEQGVPVDPPSGEERVYTEETVTRYRVVIVIMGALVAVLTLALFFTLFRAEG